MASHGLRHTYAGEWYEANISLCSPKAVAGFLGHGRDDVTNLYFMSRPRQTVKRQEMILSSLLFSLMFSI